MDNKKNILGTEKISKLLVKFAIPCVISMLVNALYNIVDQIFIGNKVGYLGNAATNIVFPITVICLGIALLFGDGAAAYLSLMLGKNQKEKANKGIGNAIVMTLIIGIIFLVIGTVFRKSLLTLFGVTEGIYPYAVEYMKYIVFGLPFMMSSIVMSSIIRADGNPKYSMFTMLVGAVLNIILDRIFLYNLMLGTKGAAIATMISEMVSFIMTICYLGRTKNFKISKETLKLEFSTIKTVASFGVSSFITQATITVIIILMNNALTKYGQNSIYGTDIPVSALGIVMKIYQIVNSIIIGIAVGAQPIFGFNYGAKKYDRVKKTYNLSIKIVLVITIIATLLFEICPKLIINIFGKGNELYQDFAVKSFRIYLSLIILNGIQILTSIFFQAIGKPKKSTILSLSRQLILLVPLILILPKLFGVIGLLFAAPIADIITFVIVLAFIIEEMRILNGKEKITWDMVKNIMNKEISIKGLKTSQN